MENLILFISFAAPLVMAILVCRGRSRTLLTFLFIGITVCLFCGEFNAIVLKLFPMNTQYFTSNFTPLFEELFKALPILIYTFLCKPQKRTLLECSVLVGVGFAVLENAYILSEYIGSISIMSAVWRGFGAGMMHGICTLLVGYGMTFVHNRRKLFYTGSTALLSIAVIYHSI